MSEAREELAAAVRSLLGQRCTVEQLQARVEAGPGVDRDLFDELAGLGVVGLAVPEDLGGQGGDLGDLAAVLVELGRALAPVPVHSTSVALALLEAAGPDAAASLGDLCARPRPATVALSEGSDWTSVETTVVDAETATVTGTKSFVLDGAAAETFVVSARRGHDLVLAVVDAGPGVTVTEHDALDLTRGVARVVLDGAPAVVVAHGEAAERALARGLDVAAVLLAAEQVGGAQACLDAAVEYAGVREQFGRPIGANQAIKHPLASLFARISGSRLLVDAAAAAIDDGDWDEVPGLASAVKQHASDTFVEGAQRNIQVHGGIGFTWEHAAHLYLRRARSTEVTYGSPSDHRERLVTLDRP